MRQGGLRDDLIGLAASRGIPGWFDPPLKVLHELPEIFGSTALEPCDELDRVMILGGVVRRLGGAVFGRRVQRPQAFVDALDHLFGELIADGVTAERLRGALERRAGRDEFERDRDTELALIYGDYLDTLAARARRDGRDTWLDCARAVESDPVGLERRLGGRREIRILGLQDLRGGWETLLRALASSPALDRVAVYSSRMLELDGLRARAVRLDEPRSAAARLFDASAPRSPGVAASVIAAPDAERELGEVARRIRALGDEGVPLHRIAVVARQARPYLDLALAALDRFGVPAAARRRHAIREIPVVRALRCLFAAAAEGWSRHGLVELAGHPCLAVELDARVLNFAGYRWRIQGLTRWVDALERLEQDAAAEEARRARAADEDGAGRRVSYPPPARIQAALEGMRRFAGRARALEGRRPLADWITWLDRFLAEDPWGILARIRTVPGERFDVVRLDLAGWNELTTIVRRWHEALDVWGGADDRIGAAEFHEQLEQLIEFDAALPTPSQRGVQVLEALAAAYRDFDHVFLVGLEAGRFPLGAPRSPILDESERRELGELGLPFRCREAWDALERELFRSLVAVPRESLTLSYARMDLAGRDTVRSGFVEALGDVLPLAGGEAEEIPGHRVLTPGARLWVGEAAAEHAALAARIELDRAGGAISPWNGQIARPELLAHLARQFGDDRRWSPTQLESFAKCPWSYFSARLLRLERLEDPDDEMDARTRGTILHAALKRFYDARREETGRPVFLTPLHEPRLAEWVDAALAQAIAAAGEGWLGHPSLLPAKRMELRRVLLRFLRAEMEEHAGMDNPRRKVSGMVRTAVAEHEVGFDDVVLERNGVRLRFRGSIDRVEVGADPRFPSGGYLAAVDYKSSASAAPGGSSSNKHAPWEDGIVLQVPLYAYALGLLRPGSRVARTEYRVLRNGDVVHPLELYRVEKSGTVSADAEAAARLEAALDAVSGHVLRARAGEFPASPAPSAGCPWYCHALEICRVAGGPVVERW